MNHFLNSILPDSQDKETPLPLIVAQKWDFPLASVRIDEETFYAIQDWIRGLTHAENPNRIWSDLKRSVKQIQMYDSIVHLPYISRDGKTYQVEHTNDKGLYMIAQGLRVTKTRLALAAIKKFLAESGAFVDKVRLNPQTFLTSGAMTPDQAIDAAIQMYRAQGKDDKWIQARIEGKIKRNQFTAALNAAVADVLTPRHYATATDDIYLGLWGRTSAYLKGELNLPKNVSLRDHQPRLALHYQGIAEEVCAKKLGERTELDWEEARTIIKIVAAFIGEQAQATSRLLSMDLATGKPLLSSGLSDTI
jgi:hypothetical protein